MKLVLYSETIISLLCKISLRGKFRRFERSASRWKPFKGIMYNWSTREAKTIGCWRVNTGMLF